MTRHKTPKQMARKLARLQRSASIDRAIRSYRSFPPVTPTSTCSENDFCWPRNGPAVNSIRVALRAETVS